MICDVCEYEHETAVHKCVDGVLRCKHCRQRAVYGKTFYFDGDEFDAFKRGDGDHRFNSQTAFQTYEKMEDIKNAFN